MNTFLSPVEKPQAHPFGYALRHQLEEAVGRQSRNPDCKPILRRRQPTLTDGRVHSPTRSPRTREFFLPSSIGKRARFHAALVLRSGATLKRASVLFLIPSSVTPSATSTRVMPVPPSLSIEKTARSVI